MTTPRATFIIFDDAGEVSSKINVFAGAEFEVIEGAEVAGEPAEVPKETDPYGSFYNPLKFDAKSTAFVAQKAGAMIGFANWQQRNQVPGNQGAAVIPANCGFRRSGKGKIYLMGLAPDGYYDGTALEGTVFEKYLYMEVAQDAQGNVVWGPGGLTQYSGTGV